MHWPGLGDPDYQCRPPRRRQSADDALMRTHKTLTTAIFAYGAAALVAMAAVAHAEAPGAATAARSPVTAEAPAASAPACRAPAEFARFVHPLAHTSRRLASDAPLVIVAIGSSSTARAGARPPAPRYPRPL